MLDNDDITGSGAPTAQGDPAYEDPAEAAPPAAVPVRRQPAWSYFLTPLAILLGSIVIAAAIWYTDDDGSSRDASHVADGGLTAAPAAAAASPALPASSASATMLATLQEYAKQLGLDAAKFQQCLGKQETGQAISRDLQAGQALGVNGTPTFFINNKRIVGAQPAAVFDEVIDAELKGSPTSLDGYSESIKQLAATSPPRFEILPEKIDVTRAPIEGSPMAKVMVAEFSDFQCPFCLRWTQDYLGKVRARVGDDVAIAFLHFPIVSIHPNAGNASAGSICAGEQGKFWPMHDLLFANQTTWASLKAN